MAREFGVITMVDTVSTWRPKISAPEEWGMDVAIAGPQKCLSGTPGPLPDVDQPRRLGGDGKNIRNLLRGSFLSILGEPLPLHPLGQ